jgi:hypothetical protein
LDLGQREVANIVPEGLVVKVVEDNHNRVQLPHDRLNLRDVLTASVTTEHGMRTRGGRRRRRCVCVCVRACLCVAVEGKGTHLSCLRQKISLSMRFGPLDWITRFSATSWSVRDKGERGREREEREGVCERDLQSEKRVRERERVKEEREEIERR